MFDELLKFFGANKSEKPDLVPKLKLDPDLLKKKIMKEFIHQSEPKEKDTTKQTIELPRVEAEVTEFKPEHAEHVKEFLKVPSIDKLNKMKDNGTWKHLNKIFSNYGKE